MSERILYHGSVVRIAKPEYGKGKPYNDYGVGFYCTEERSLAAEWAVASRQDGYVNEYAIETDGLRILNLSSDEYTILHWLALLLAHRTLNRATPVARRAIDFLQRNYLPEISAYDVIVGYRADDSYFAFARAFAGNEISLAQLGRAMRLGRLGEQFVLKSSKAFAQVRFVGAEPVECATVYPLRKERDDAAREAYRQEIERADIDGLFMRDIIRGGIMPNDPRLR